MKKSLAPSDKLGRAAPPYDVCREKITISLVVRLAVLSIVLALSTRVLLRLPQRVKPSPPFSFDMYFRAMNGDLDLYSSSVYKETPAMQRALYRHQSPADCSRARFLIFELWNHGLGSVYLGASTALALAAASGRVLHLAEPRGGWVHSRGCGKRGAACFFRPAGRCAPPAAALANATRVPPAAGWVRAHPARVLVLRFEPPFLAPARRNLTAVVRAARTALGLPPARGRAAARRWHAQASLYLLRLAPRVQAAARRGLAGCAGGGSAEMLVTRTLGVPLRGSDKCGGAGAEMRCVGAAGVARAAARVRGAHPWVSAALVTSEDGALARQVARRLAPRWAVRHNLGDVQQGSGHPFARHGLPPFRVMDAALVSMTCQVMPAYHVLTPRSNFHALIDMLAKVVPGKPFHLSHAIGEPQRPW